MDRLTITRSLPSEGTFIVLSEEERREIQHSKVNERDIYKRLQEYENTGLSPDEIIEMKECLDEIRPFVEKHVNDFVNIYSGESSVEGRCKKANRCLFGPECPHKLVPINDFYGCFDAGRYDKSLENVPKEIYDMVKRDIIRKKWLEKNKKTRGNARSEQE